MYACPQELARRHKQRLYFPFTLSQQPYSRAGHERAAELAPLLQSPLLDTWAASLNDMTYPAQRWQAWVSQLDRLLSSGKMVTYSLASELRHNLYSGCAQVA